jgi:selenocysteine lyase/cysteine desulfurase
MLACQRDKFSIPNSISYLDAAYMSPIPTTALEAGKAGVAVKSAPWTMTIDSYYDEVEEARRLAATMINASPEDMSIVAATSYGIAVAAANVTVSEGSSIILMNNEHPSHRYVWYDLAERTGAKIRLVDPPADGDWTAAIVEAIAATPKVAVVAGTMLHWFEGAAVDLEAVSRATKAAGAALVVDGTQWVGALPFDVTRVAPDFLVFAMYKFMLGPYRLAFLYADKRWQRDGRPIEHHVWNRDGGELPNFYEMDVRPYSPGARRFDMGERSDFAVLPIAIASMKLIESWTVDEVAGRLRHLNKLIWDQAAGAGAQVPNERLRPPHIAILDIGEAIGPKAKAYLKEQGIYVTTRGTKVRISPHVYNDEADIARLFEELSTLRSRAALGS